METETRNPTQAAVSTLSQRTIVVGVGGGIAAYKVAELLRLLKKAGATVHVVMTAAAQKFITPLTLQTLSGNPVGTELFDLEEESRIGHIALADAADLLLIAPATADLLARLALGLGNDLLTTLALACRAPLLLAPAMNVNMWQHPAVRGHVELLQARGATLVGPEPGELACGWVGAGRLSEPAAIVEKAAAILGAAPAAAARELVGRHVLITAGPTFEAIDPVRFIGNRSSGKMGFALAREAARRGARVTLVAGPVALPTPPGVERIDVESAAEMAAAVLPALAADPSLTAATPDVIVMSAAVADYRPSEVKPQKLKKHELGAAPQIQLSPTVDILAELGRRRGDRRRPLLVGFAAETTALESHAEAKLRQKGCDLIVGNDVSEPGSGFGTETNRVTLFSFAPTEARARHRPASAVTENTQPVVLVERLAQLPKDRVAALVWDRVIALLHGKLEAAAGGDSVSESEQIS